MDTEDSKDTASDSEELKSAPESMKGDRHDLQLRVKPKAEYGGDRLPRIQPSTVPERHVYLSQAAKW